MKIIIVGGGKVGFYLAKSMRSQGYEAVIIEQDKEQCRSCADLLDVRVCCGDGTSQEVLRTAGAEDADVVAGSHRAGTRAISSAARPPGRYSA